MGTARNAARRRCNYNRALPSPVRDDTNIVADRIDEEWQRGIDWACVALILTFDPMLALGIWLGW